MVRLNRFKESFQTDCFAVQFVVVVLYSLVGHVFLCELVKALLTINRAATVKRKEDIQFRKGN